MSSIKFFFFLAVLLNAKTLFSGQRLSSSCNKQVTATEYCEFLNVVAATDEHHLYNQAISTDPSTACIARAGAPGWWHYEVIQLLARPARIARVPA